MSKPRWRKVIADIFDNKMRSFVVLASIFIGVFAIGVIGTLFQLILEETQESYESSNPANIKIKMLDFGDDFLRSTRKMEGVAQVEGRRVVNLAITDHEGKLVPFQVIGIEDFDHSDISKISLIDGNLPLNEGEIIVALEFLQDNNFSIGDTLSIEISSGHFKEFKIVGSVEDWTLEINQIFMNKGLGFVSMNSIPLLGEPYAYNTLLATVSTDPYDKQAINQVNQALTDKIEDTNRIVFSSKIFQKDVPPLNSIIISLLSILTFLGLLIMILSGFLIANTMNSLLLQQSRQIGVMKLMGAKRKQIIHMYLILSIAYGLMAIIFAIPAGLVVGRIASELISDLVNAHITGVGLIPFLPIVIIAQILVAVLIPVLASLMPVLKGTRTTVRKALSGELVKNDIEESKLDLWLENLPGVNAINKISVRNTFRRKGRLLTTIFALALAGAIFISVFNTKGSLDTQMEDSANLMGVDVNIQFSKSYNKMKIEETLMALPEIVYAEAWGTDIAYYDNSKMQNEVVTILAPQINAQTIHPTVIKGRWFVEGDQRAIIVNKNFLKRDPSLDLGSSITIELNGNEEEWTIVGVTHVIGDDDLEAYIPMSTWEKEKNSKNNAAAYRLILADHSLENQLALEKSLYEWLEDSGYHVSSLISVEKTVNDAVQMTDIIVWVLLIIAILTAFVGSIGMTGTLGMNIIERTSEIGILRAIGGNNQVIKRLVLMEGLIIGFISYLFSVLLSFPVTIVLKSLVIQSIFGTTGKLVIAWQGFLMWFILVLIFSVVASVVPARNATNLTIREVLAYE